MSIQWIKKNLGILAGAGLLLCLFMAAPPCFASGAVKLIPDERQLAPRGSYIPDRRVNEVLKKIEAQKVEKAKKKALQQQEQQENKSPKP